MWAPQSKIHLRCARTPRIDMLSYNFLAFKDSEMSAFIRTI